MTDIVVWPHKILTAREAKADLVPFSRSGGRSLGGIEPATRTDRGWWSISLSSLLLHTTAQRRTWNAIRTKLGGRAGLVAVPVWSHDSAPFVNGTRVFPSSVTHSDGTTFSDGTGYRQRTMVVKMADAVAIGDTSCRLEIVNAAADLAGVRFSYQHALYETGPATLISGSFWTVPIFPAARAAIPAGAELELDMPTCLCRLADDRGMNTSLVPSLIDDHSAAFVEAVDFWSNLAAGLITSPFLS